MDHHFVPQVYLRQWCSNGRTLIRYVRKGRTDSLKLLSESKTPRAICHAEDLNRLPDGTMANGMTGHGVEELLARSIDDKITSIIKLTSNHSGPLDISVGNKIRWLMQTFIARSPSMLAAGQKQVRATTQEHRELIHRLISRAQTPKFKAESEQFLRPEFPAVYALATLAAIASTSDTPTPGWLEGTAHAFHRNTPEASSLLKDLGLNEFPTYEAPVVSWDDNNAGLIASFTLSPEVLVFIIQNQGTNTAEMARKHILNPLRYRESAICRSEASPDGVWWNAAQHLRPFSQGK